MLASRSAAAVSRHLRSQRAAGSRAFRAVHADYAILGGGPVGASTAWQLAEKLAERGEERKVVMVHDPTRKGAYEDYSRLARLSFDSNAAEMEVSRHALELLDLVDEVQSYNSGSPVIPMRPGMLFVASPGTPLAAALERGEAHGDSTFRRHTAAEVNKLYPGNEFNLPEDTLCWSHPLGYCVDPIQMAVSLQQMSKSYGVEVVEGWANLDMAETGDNFVISTDGTDVVSKNCFLFPGARNQEIVDLAIKRGEKNRALEMVDLQSNYITAISTVRFAHANGPLSLKYDAAPARDVVECAGDGLDQVIPPIVLGQIVKKDLLSYTANFSIVAEELGNVYKVRLSGKAGSEVIPRVGDMYSAVSDAQNEEQLADYQRFFSVLFPYLDTSKALDFNRCITYRNKKPKFNGYSLLRKSMGDLNLFTTPGCFGVGVKFGPLLGELAADNVLGNASAHEVAKVHEDGVEEVVAMSDDQVAAGRLAEVY
eukprot:TRINITY_DN38293_c0_g1_i1.p2 TRINITY_DN38293_c0_g1~~TRINITY_DN38293_c0_g1_i1.p2  ORF type:complete len:482 (+),score=134.78 TRINITY_DN38293_c0_g1_i1:65-1510(+)